MPQSASTSTSTPHTPAYRRQPAEKQELLLEAARKLFAEQGFDGTSTLQVAKAAGVSEGTLFHHFGSKKGLFLAVAQQFAEAAALATMPEHPDLLTEEGIVRRAFDFADANPHLYQTMRHGSGELTEQELARQSEAIVATIEARLREGIANGVVRSGDPRIMAELQFAVVDAAYRAWRLSGERNLREKYIEEAVNCMTCMLTP